MATPRTPNQKKQYAALNSRLLAYSKRIQQLYDKFNREVAKIVARTDYNPDDGEMFHFQDYPKTRAAINNLLNDYVGDMIGTINRGTSEEWKRSNEFQDLVANKVLTAYGVKNRNGEEFTKYYQNNSDHLKAFQTRTINGMNLSRRVWNLREQYKQELEMGLSVGIEQGTSAVKLAGELKKYLNEPDRLFRRVRDKFGNLQLSKNARAYHPGRGIYRSSYKNALRLARSEINMAYRTAEQTRWQQFDFVVGYEIKLSHAHEQRMPDGDICDVLAGRYPKDFVWTGWHPNDMCYVVSILKSEEEFWEGDDSESANKVEDVPEAFKEWCLENRDKIEAAEYGGTQPYFVRDNKAAIDKIFKDADGTEEAEEKKTPQEIAAERHAKRDAEDIQKRWGERKNRLEHTTASFWNAEYVNELERAGFYIDSADVLIKQMVESPFSKLDVVKLDTDIRKLMSQYGFNEYSISGSIKAFSDGSVTLEWSDWNNRFKLIRKFFIDNDGRKVVDHHLFDMAPGLQGKGISRKLFPSLYEQYKATGIKRMEVVANIDVGGYTWARYGFCVKDRETALSAIRYSALTAKQEKRIVEIIDKHFQTSSEPFPMNKIAKLPYGKKALLGSYWDGVLDLTNPKQRATFEGYLRG